jgi:hypothetical protein
LVRQGRIEALKRGKDWNTTRRALDQHLQSLEK